ncbi:MAG TPA: zinc dependent phospholipase C family protein [Candidatus Binatia bacterium]|nr:zinc dependent phospholipase C family protein [Candidatus Binatia bacterium]
MTNDLAVHVSFAEVIALASKTSPEWGNKPYSWDILNPVPLMKKARNWTLVFLIAFAWSPTRAAAYSVLTHEELIDLAWNDSIRPLLLARFPRATEKQLIEAHAYAYGGSAIQDMGYYPFGKRLFSNLTHYARTGDFIAWLFHNARNLNEYAFAVGALSHYLGDTIGHSQAVNPATALEFSKLKQEFGDSVTYGESPHAHIRTEFAFDIDELTDLAFAPPTYLERIGFKVPRKFLEQAFVSTYGFDIHEILGRARPALRSYRTSVRRFIPAFAEAEVVLHRHQFPPHPDDEAYRTFAERVARTNYERHGKHTYKGPGIRAHLLAVLVFLVPKIGGASDLAIKIPTPKTEEWYLQSVNQTLDTFRETLHKHLSSADPRSIPLANLDLDTGNPAKFGDYPLADQTYAHLVLRLASSPNHVIPADLKQNILEYYAGFETLAEANGQLRQQLETVKAMKSVPDPR